MRLLFLSALVLFTANLCTSSDVSSNASLSVIITDNENGYQISELRLSMGDSARLNCEAQGGLKETNLTLLWGVNQRNISRIFNNISGNSIQNISSVWLLDNVTKSDAGVYDCIVSINNQIYMSSVTVYVDDYMFREPPLSIIITNYENGEHIFELHLSIGDSARLNCVAHGGPSDTNLTLWWMKQRSLIQDTSNTRSENSSQNLSFVLSLDNVSRSDAGVYNCWGLINDQTYESNVTIYVGSDVELAIVTTSANTTIGSGVMFTCAGFSHTNSNISLSWTKSNTGILTTNGAFCITERNFMQGSFLFKQSFLQIRNLSCDHTGIYTCLLSNGISSVINSMKLKLKEKHEQTFQIKFGSSKECNFWMNQVDLITTTILDNFDALINDCECNFYEDTITNAAVFCSNNTKDKFFIYRASLHHHCPFSNNILTKQLEKWVSGSPIIQVGDDLIQVDSSCKFCISSFNDPLCHGKDSKERNHHTPWLLFKILVFISIVLFTLAVIVGLTGAVLLVRKSKLPVMSPRNWMKTKKIKSSGDEDCEELHEIS